MVQRLNLSLSRKCIEDHIKAADENGDGVLQFHEFVTLMRQLRHRKELANMFLALLDESMDDLAHGKLRATRKLSKEVRSLAHALCVPRGSTGRVCGSGVSILT
jgi:predicted transcriptional regulator